MVRHPVFAGKFYPSEPEVLRRTIENFLSPASEEPATALVMPHAGYGYSGKVAAATAFTAVMPHTLVLLGPNHTGMGHPFSVMCRGTWQTPLGASAVDEPLACAVLQESELVQEDPIAHQYEHSLEVQLPFFHYRNPSVPLLPIVINSYNPEHYRAVGTALAAAARRSRPSVLFVASTDLSHYVPEENARSEDRYAIDAITALDPDALVRVVRQRNISMCGVAPVAVALHAANAAGARSARLVAYDTSAGVGGADPASVVGYAGFVIC